MIEKARRSARTSVPSSRSGAAVRSARSAGVQRRGVERVQAILDAASELLLDGYEAATLKAIAERTGIPVASIYHYFADRHQIDVELIQRHVRAFDDRVKAALDASPLETLPEAVETVVDESVAYFRENPSLIQLWYVGRNSMSKTVRDFVRAYDASRAEELAAFLLRRKLVRADMPTRVVGVACEAADRLFDTAFELSPQGDEGTIVETKRLVTAYLETYAART
ncbi:TetR/AcrR family transcriptional regulator [Gordonia desulfuricans]|uniref:TetR/AcrR family transcriptional regulator n=1 Tax=Gordonia desulfuricans TaxID=89051 RepID=UPI001FD0BD5A|nr:MULTISPECIES: TetR family transcriptional regulator [Gordonia]